MDDNASDDPSASFKRMRERLVENAGGTAPSPEAIAEQLTTLKRRERRARVRLLFVGLFLFLSKVGLVSFSLWLALPRLFEMFPGIPFDSLGFWQTFVMVGGFMLAWLIWPQRMVGVPVEIE